MLEPRSVISSIAIALFSTALCSDAEKAFRPAAADSYAHQTSDGVVIGAQVYDQPQLIEQAFGKKVNFAKYGLTPVLVVVENRRKQTVDLRAISVNLVSTDGRHVSAVKPEEISSMAGRGQRPPQVPMNLPIPKRKAAITSPQIVQRAFAAEMLAPGDSASGFFYFNATPEAGDKLYVDGLQEMPSGRDVTFFEFAIRE